MLLPRLEFLFNCYIQNKYTFQEGEELMALLLMNENQCVAEQLIGNMIENTESEFHMNDQAADSILQKILHQDNSIVIAITKKKSVFLYWKNVAAVAILFLAGAAFLKLDKKNDNKSTDSLVAQRTSPILI